MYVTRICGIFQIPIKFRFLKNHNELWFIIYEFELILHFVWLSNWFNFSIVSVSASAEYKDMYILISISMLLGKVQKNGFRIFCTEKFRKVLNRILMISKMSYGTMFNLRSTLPRKTRPYQIFLPDTKISIPNFELPFITHTSRHRYSRHRIEYIMI